MGGSFSSSASREYKAYPGLDVNLLVLCHRLGRLAE
jgi:hypothetical protein